MRPIRSARGRPVGVGLALALVIAGLAGCAFDLDGGALGSEPVVAEEAPTGQLAATDETGPEPDPASDTDRAETAQERRRTYEDPPQGVSVVDQVTNPGDFSTRDVNLAPTSAARFDLVEVRVTSLAGFDRVTFVLSGTGVVGLPGVDIRYVPAAWDDGSGDPVAVLGDQVLQVRLAGIAAPFESQTPSILNQTFPGDGSAVAEVVLRSWFEGYITAFVGVSGEAPRPFGFSVESDPPRVVIDIAN